MLTDAKVNLFIVGAAKAGTTTIFNLLGGNLQVCMCSLKEPNYFSSAALKQNRLYYHEPVIEKETEYHKLFNPSPVQHIIGEASVSYLFYPGTAAKIFAYNPKARIIIMLRDPADRAFSHYLMDKKLGYVKYSFDEIVKQGEHSEKQNQYFQQYISYGLYYRQVKSYLDIFPSEQVKIILFQQLQSSPQDVLNDITSFLGLDSKINARASGRFNEASLPRGKFVSVLYQSQAIRKVLKSLVPGHFRNKIQQLFFVSPGETLNSTMRKQLQQYYLQDIKILEQLIHQNLQPWYE